MAIAFVATSLGNLAIFLGDPRAAHTVVFWMLGGLGLAQWSHLIYPLAVLVPAGLWLWSQSGALNAMSLGDETAASLGIPVARFLQAPTIAGLSKLVAVAFESKIKANEAAARAASRCVCRPRRRLRGG